MSPTFIEVIEDKRLLGQFIKDQSTRKAWKTFWKAVDALPPDKEDLELFKECTQRRKWPKKPAKEAWMICGVRGGKSENIAQRLAYLGVFGKHNLSPGEKCYLINVSVTKKQAALIKSYVSTYFRENDYFRPYLLRETTEELELSNGVVVAILSSDFRSLRGFTAGACVIEEAGYLPFEGSRPSEEVARALRSRLVSTGGPLYSIGSPFAKFGIQWEIYEKHFGKTRSPIFVWQSGSLIMNPTLSTELVNQALEDDPIGGATDYLAQFRSDWDSYVPRDVVVDCVVLRRYELSPQQHVQHVGFVDSAGGSGRDSMALCIGHMEKDGTRVIDLIREVRPTFSPDKVVEDFSKTLKTYGISQIVGDRYASEWPRERFQKHGIHYVVCELTKSDLYRELLPILMAGKIELLDNDRLVDQLCRLERRVIRSGREYIDHGVGRSDDLSNVVAGCSFILKDVPLSDGRVDIKLSDTSHEYGNFSSPAGDYFGRDRPSEWGSGGGGSGGGDW
jgi:hypothetical protein